MAHLQHNHKGQIDELMYAEDSLCYLIKPNSKKKIKDIETKRAAWLEDYLYLPSHITFNQRAEILRKYGNQALVVEKDVSASKLNLLIYVEILGAPLKL